jgi:hypothetical protein
MEEKKKEDTLKPITKVSSKLDKEMQEWEVESTTSGGWWWCDQKKSQESKKPTSISLSPKDARLVITNLPELDFTRYRMVIFTLQHIINERIAY